MHRYTLSYFADIIVVLLLFAWTGQIQLRRPDWFGGGH